MTEQKHYKSDECDAPIEHYKIGDSDECTICLIRLKLRSQELGKPENCKHLFCLECISEWAKVCCVSFADSKESKLDPPFQVKPCCPFDRSYFSKILILVLDNDSSTATVIGYSDVKQVKKPLNLRSVLDTDSDDSFDLRTVLDTDSDDSD